MRKINLQMNGDKIRATWDGLDYMTVPPSGHGSTIASAVDELIGYTDARTINNITSSIENEPFEKTVKP